MKVKDVLKKINYGSAKIPVYLQDGAFGFLRRVSVMEFSDDRYDEKDRTVASISLLDDKVVIHYQ